MYLNMSAIFGLDECCSSNRHLTHCDDDGFCSFCGFQDVAPDSHEEPKRTTAWTGAWISAGGQKPIEIFFVVNRESGETSFIRGLYQLAELFAGARITNPNVNVDDEYAIFTDRESAESFATKVSLVAAGKRYLERLPVKQLQELVPAIHWDSAESTIDSINQYTE